MLFPGDVARSASDVPGYHPRRMMRQKHLAIEDPSMLNLTPSARKELEAYFADKEKQTIRIFLAPGG